MAHKEDCVQTGHERPARAGLKVETLLLMLMGVVMVQMIANVGLFLRMNQLQQEVLATLRPFQAAREPEALKIGTKAPTFSLADTEGRMVSLHDLAGRRVLLVFSSIQCSACAGLWPHLRTFGERHPDIAVLVLSRGSSEENQALTKAQANTIRILTLDSTTAQAYQITAVPFCYLLDGEGVIAAAGIANTLEQLEDLAGGSEG